MEILQSKNDLYKVLEDLIKENIANEEFIKSIQKIFMGKNMSLNTIVLLLNGTLEINELSLEELIATTEAAYKIFKNENLKPERYFNEEEMAYFDGYIYSEEDRYYTNKIELLEAKEIKQELIYQGYLTLKEVYMMFKNGLFFYYKPTQREPELKKIGTKNSEENIIESKSMNRTSVKEIKNLMLAENYLPDEIHFNIRIMDDKTPRYSFVKYPGMKETGKLTIEPNYNRNDEDTTYVDIVDGYHRFLSGKEAFEEHLRKTGEELEGGLTVIFTLLEVDKAQEFMARKFKRNDTGLDYLKVKENGDYMKIVNKIVENFEFDDQLKIVDTWERLRVYNSFACKVDFEYVIKNCTGINASKIGEARSYSKKVSEILNDLILALLDKFDNIDEFKNTDLRGKMIAGYIAIADRLKETSRPIKYIDSVVETLYRLNEIGEISKMKMVTANANLNTIYNYFYNLADEIVKNA